MIVFSFFLKGSTADLNSSPDPDPKLNGITFETLESNPSSSVLELDESSRRTSFDPEPLMSS